MLSERLVLGTAQAKPGYGVTIQSIQQESEFFSMLKVAKQLDIQWIDTAQNYGLAESWIGKNSEFHFQVASKIAIKGSDLEIFYGKIDAKPRPAHKSLSTAEAAAKEAEKLIREKLAKGYKEVSA
jgi:predicted DNA-binding WGR domain protein